MPVRAIIDAIPYNLRKKDVVFFAEEERQLAKGALTVLGKSVKGKFASTSRSTQEAQGAPH